MPRLIVFGMCQKAIIDREDSSVSMISLLNSVNVTANMGPIEPKTIIPLSWAVVSSWIKLPEDEGKTFEQRICILWPDGTTNGEATVAFKMSERAHQNTIAGNAFPVGLPGEYQIQLWLREVADDKNFELIREHPFEVLHPK